MSTTAVPAIDSVAKPEAAPSVAPQPAPIINEPPKNVPEGAGPAVGAPKPVEVTSVPPTPQNNGTPAGGTPRPELNIEEEPPKEKTPEPPVILGPGDGEKKDAPEPISDVNGPNGAGVLGEKRKAEVEQTDLPATNGGTPVEKKDDDQRPEKKPKVTEKIADKVAEVKDKVTGGGDSEKKKAGRPKKDKKAPPAVGRTERKTRSQGAVAAEGV